MKINIDKVFYGRHGEPLTLININDEDFESFADSFSRTGLQEHEYFCLYEEEEYSGFNIVWQCIVKPEDVRKFFKNLWNKKSIKFDREITWDIARATVENILRHDIINLCDSGINVKSKDNRRFKITGNDTAKFAHFVGLQWFKESYIRCYNQDNGIKDGGCFITTAVCDNFGKADDCYELTKFREFRDKWLINQYDGKFLIEKYYTIAPIIVTKINQLNNSNEIYNLIWQKYLNPCLSFIENKKYKECKNLYISMMNTLKKDFLK